MSYVFFISIFMIKNKFEIINYKKLLIIIFLKYIKKLKIIYLYTYLK